MNFISSIFDDYLEGIERTEKNRHGQNQAYYYLCIIINLIKLRFISNMYWSKCTEILLDY